MIEREYDRLARTYDRRWSKYVDRTVNATIDRLRIVAGDRLLDLGCGTGVLIDRCLNKYPHIDISGVDLSEAMLSIARQKLPDSICLKNASVESLPFEDSSFDAIVSSSVFHYFPNPQLALSEIRRILKPDGQILITDWCRDYYTCKLLGYYLRYGDRAPVWIYTSQEMTDLLIMAGFSNINIDRYKIDWYWGMMSAIAHPENFTIY